MCEIQARTISRGDQLTALDGARFAKTHFANLLKTLKEIYFSSALITSTVHVPVCTSIQPVPFLCLATAVYPSPSFFR